MKTLLNTIAYPATYEDLLFLNKNKQYGAYILRKTYKRNIILATIISVILFSLSITSPLLFKEQAVSNFTQSKDTVQIILLPPPSIPKSDGNVLEHIPIAINTKQFFVPIVKPDDLVKVNNMVSIDSLINAVPWHKTQIAVKGGYDVTLTEKVEIPEKVIVDNTDNQPPHTWAEVMPSYRGGNEELLAFFAREINYPEIARKVGIEGKVFLSFVVEKDGSITNAAVERGIEGGCKEEALRVLLLLGKWRPGMQNGVPVRVKMVLPVLFSLR